MWSLSRAQRALAAGAAVLSLFLLPSTGSAQEPGPYPGLPSLPSDYDPFVRNTYGWLNVAQVGRTGSVPAKQWARIPLGIVASNIDFSTREYTNEAGQTLVDGLYDIYSFLIPQDADSPYGESAIITVRTVAFGSIPAEVRVQLRQRRDDADLPIGFHLTPTLTTNYDLQQQIYPSMTLKDDVDIAVVGLTVDGVDLHLGSTCASGPTAKLDLASESVVVDNAAGETFDQDHGFSGIEGGTLDGTLDIPAFSGCSTANGDDISPILTSAISGPDNPVTVKLGILGCYSGFDPDSGAPLPGKPGISTGEAAGCPPDSSDTVEGVPGPLPLPDHAPGD